MPPELATELAAEGFYRMLVPHALGGLEVHPAEFAAALEALALGDSAVGWTIMTGATTGLLAAYLPEAGAEALFRDPAGTYAGVFAPMGVAVPEGTDGYRLCGRWPFASGVENAIATARGRARPRHPGRPAAPHRERRARDSFALRGGG